MKLDFTNPQIVVCIGKPKRGKTNCLKYFILKNTVDNKIFKYGIVFSKTASFNKDYDYMPKEYIYSDFDRLSEVLEKFIDGISKLKKREPCFAVFDDCQGLLDRQDKTLLNFIAIHRHLNCSIFFNFQYLYGSMPTLRSCTTICVMFNAKGKRTIEGLFECFGQLFPNQNAFREYFLELTSEPYVAMLYLQDIDDIEDNYLYFKCPDMTKYKNIKLDF